MSNIIEHCVFPQLCSLAYAFKFRCLLCAVCCLYGHSVSPVCCHSLPALRSTVITRFIATMADSAIHTPSFRLSVSILPSLQGGMDFPSSCAYLYRLADVSNPGERYLQISRFSYCSFLLLAGLLNPSALTPIIFRG